MKEDNKIGTGCIIGMFLALILIIGASIWVFRTTAKTVADMTDQTQALIDVLENGSVVMGMAVKTGNAATIGDRLGGKNTYAVELHYTVGGVEYTSPAYQFSGEVFDGLEGEDDRKQIEIHYDPNNPQTASAAGILMRSLLGTKVLGE